MSMRLVPSMMGCLLLAIALPVRAGEVTIQPVRVDDLKEVFGTVESVKTTSARARTEGTVELLSVSEGDEVQAGQTMAKIVDAKLKLNLQSIEARTKALKAEQSLAQTEFERMKKLRASDVVAQADLDRANGKFEEATHAVEAAEADRDVVLQQNKDADIPAPAAGRVLKVNVVNGSVLRPGESLAEIATTANVVRLRLPERHARFIKPGQIVQLQGRQDGEGRTSSVIEGHIRLVYPELVQGRVVADVEAEGLSGAYVGERTPVRISTGQRETILIPEGALIRRSGLTFVKLKSGQDIVVQAGEKRGDQVEILSGLRAGDVVVTP